jgi:hypothetical protein
MREEFGTKIVAAACSKDGVIFTIPAPARHHDIVHRMHLLGIVQDYTLEQGFLTDTGRFVRRKPAMIIAEKAGQLIRSKEGGYQGPELFSEDLW